MGQAQALKQVPAEKKSKFSSDIVELKGGLEGFDPRIFVAFANSERGGTIMVRVASKQDVKTIHTLTNMADDCVPSVAVDISIESKGEKPYLRIEVPSGMNKPYCTPKGHYVTRADGGIRPLQPNELFTLFQKKTGNLGGGNNKGYEQIIDIIGSVEQYVYENNVQMDKRFGKINTVLDAILNKMGIEDPLLDDKRENIQRDGTLLFMMGQTIEEVTAEMRQHYPYLKDRLIEKWLLETHALFQGE